MRSKPYWFLFVLAVLACGRAHDDPVLSVSGTVGSQEGPLYVAISQGESVEAVMRDPLGHVKTLCRTREDGRFSMDLSGTGLVPGDRVVITAFADVVEGAIPTPDPGDLIGFYTDPEGFFPFLTLGLENKGVAIEANRRIYAFHKEIELTVTGDYTGPVILLAYGGALDPSDPGRVDPDGVAGYASVMKAQATQVVTMTILPFGVALPASDIYLLALYDANGNHRLDSGERVGYFTDNPLNLPSRVTLTADREQSFVLGPITTVPPSQPGGFSIRGAVAVPARYATSSDPLYLIVASGSSPRDLELYPMEHMKHVEALAQGTRHYAFDAGVAGLAVGDEVMLFALWDHDGHGGIPELSFGDEVAFLVDTDSLESSFALRSGPNLLGDGEGALQFRLNRRVVDHASWLAVSVDGELDAAENLVVVAVQEKGVNAILASSQAFHVSDPDYVLAMGCVTALPGGVYSVPLFGALPGDVVRTEPFGVDSVYVYLVRDVDGNGRPDTGEAVAFVPGQVVLGRVVPGTVNIRDGENAVTVRFTGETF